MAKYYANNNRLKDGLSLVIIWLSDKTQYIFNIYGRFSKRKFYTKKLISEYIRSNDWREISEADAFTCFHTKKVPVLQPQYYSESKREYIPVGDMIDEHLANAIRKAERNGNAEELRVLSYEAGKRGLVL